MDLINTPLQINHAPKRQSLIANLHFAIFEQRLINFPIGLFNPIIKNNTFFFNHHLFYNHISKFCCTNRVAIMHSIVRKLMAVK
jgi:hypothetical protein